MSNNSNPFLARLSEKIIVFDGAVGTNLQRRNLSVDDFWGQEGCNELLVRSRPDVVRDLHASFLEVGSDVIETNTFGGTAVVLAEYELDAEDYNLNLEAARLAKAVAQDYSSPAAPRFVAGSLGPGTKLPSLGHISFTDLHAAYRRQVAGLIDGGVDLLIVETCQDLLQVKAVLIAIFDEFEARRIQIPVIAQVTMETTGTMLLGSDMQAAMTTLAPFPIDVLGLNCATGPKAMGAHIRTLASMWARPISVMPNAGMPRNENGQMVYDLTPAELESALHHFVVDLGVNIVGGCCGTGPEHLAAVVKSVGQLAPQPRSVEWESGATSLYSVAAYDVDPKPLLIGERTNSNGSKRFREYLLADDIDGMLMIAKEQIREQAHILDVCTAYVGRDEVRDMSRFVYRLNTDSTIPLMIDSTEIDTIEVALQRIAGKSLINSINLEDGEERARKVLTLCKRHGAGVVALTIDEDGMAKTADKKIAIAERLYDLAVNEYGLAPEDIFFDTLTFTLGSGDDEFRTAAVETIEAIRRIKAKWPDVHTILGVSNISFGLRPIIRHKLNSVFMHHAVAGGLDAAIVHAGKIQPLYKLPEEERNLIEDLIFDRRSKDYDPLLSIIEFYQDKKSGKQDGNALAELPLTERLEKRIIDGSRVGLDLDLDDALKEFDALHIINKILLNGMKTVGKLFASGEMQLPFVLQSAETMKAAVSHLEPFMDKQTGGGKGKMIIATVRGDVHDIGKNLVDIILSNNGYEIVNLGIKQPIEAIIEAYDREGADAIGMSGLLVKSTIIMKQNLESMVERNITPLVILGGAALTRKYVEHDLRSIYPGGQVYYAKDAFDGLRLMEELASGDSKPEVPITEAPPVRVERPSLSSRKRAIVPVEPPIPPFWGSRVVEGLPVATIAQYVNKVALFRGQWGIKKQGRDDKEYKRLVQESLDPEFNRLLKRAASENLLEPKVVYGYYPCNSEGDNLHVYAGPDENTPLLSINFPRQGEKNGRCIADFFQPVESGLKDVLALHLVTVGQQATLEAQHLFETDRYTDYLYFHGFAVEMAEALAEYWHKEIRRELGIDTEDADDIPSLFRQHYRGSRYSFGYPACPSLEDQEHVFTLLDPSRIDVQLTEQWQLVPEQSTSAIIVHHPDAKYFSIK